MNAFGSKIGTATDVTLDPPPVDNQALSQSKEAIIEVS